MSVYLGAMPADGFDAAAKKSGPRHVPLAAPKRAMSGTYISGKDVGRGMAVMSTRTNAAVVKFSSKAASDIEFDRHVFRLHAAGAQHAVAIASHPHTLRAGGDELQMTLDEIIDQSA